jgi:cell division protein FtsL
MSPRARGALLAGLALASFGSAVGVVLAKHESRIRFVELRELEATRDALNVEWNRLQLEERTLASQARIETAARERLGMEVPAPADAGVLGRP